MKDPLWSVPWPFDTYDPISLRDNAVKRSIEAHFQYVEHMEKMRDIIARLHRREDVKPG